jgi:hypothetical protein
MSSISISTIIILCALLFPFVPSKPLTPIIFQWYLFAIYKAPNEAIQDTIHRYIQHDLPCKFRYVLSNPQTRRTFAHQVDSWSITVSIKASQNALCSVFSSFPSNQDCKWGGVSIILPWVTAIFGGCPLSIPFPVSRKTHIRFDRRRRVGLYNR